MSARERLVLERREASSSDREFLCELFVRNAETEFSALGWSREQLVPLLRMQFDGRMRDWSQRFGGCPEVISHQGVPVATIWLARAEEGLVVVDIAVDEGWRRGGIATQLLQEAQTAAALASLPLQLTVSTRNPGAQELYHKLGFQVVAEDSLTRSMVWSVQPAE